MVPGKPAENVTQLRATPPIDPLAAVAAPPIEKAANGTRNIAAAAGADVDDANSAAQFLRHKGKLEQLLAAQRVANKAVQDHGKIVRRDCGDHGYDAMKFAIKVGAADDGLEQAQGEIQAKLNALRWLGVPMGAQTDLFGADRRPIGERAYMEGRIAGLEGVKSQKENPHDLSTEAGQEWVRGYHDGQGFVFDKMPGASGSAELLKEGAKKGAGKKAAPKGEPAGGEDGKVH